MARSIASCCALGVPAAGSCTTHSTSGATGGTAVINRSTIRQVGSDGARPINSTLWDGFAAAPRDPAKFGDEFTPRPADGDAVNAWRVRMGGGAAREVYKQRAATSETVNADLKTHRGLVQLTVRGIAKATCVALWSALAYNLMHFGTRLIG